MADNITLDAGSGGAVVKTDDDGTAHWQYVKLAHGADNTQTRVTASAGLPVTPDSGGFTVDLGATDNAVLDAIQTAVEAVETQTVNLQNCIIQDDAPFTPATGYLMMIGGEFDDAAPDSVDEGDAGNVRITANRSFHTVIRDNAGNERGLNVDANGEIGVTLGNATLPDTSGGDLASIATDAGTVAGAVSGTEMQVDVVASLPAGTNAIGKLAENSGVDIGDVDVTSISAGSNLIGDVGISGARTSGGTTIFRSIDVDETEDEVKATAGQVYWVHAMNLGSSVRYLKFYNAAAASVSVGTTTPVMTFPLPTQGDSNGAGFTLSVPNGIAFDTGICVAATTGIADNDTGAPGANEVVVNLGYA